MSSYYQTLYIICLCNFLSGSLVDRLPHYMFMTALPQLISRICHSNNEVFVQLCKIIATMVSSYPQQAMWHMIAVSKVRGFRMRISVLNYSPLIIVFLAIPVVAMHIAEILSYVHLMYSGGFNLIFSWSMKL